MDLSLQLRLNGVKHIRSAPYHPASNGQAEYFVQKSMKAMVQKEGSRSQFKRALNQFLLTCRTTPHSTTGETPFLFLKGEVRTRLDLLRPKFYR